MTSVLILVLVRPLPAWAPAVDYDEWLIQLKPPVGKATDDGNAAYTCGWHDSCDGSADTVSHALDWDDADGHAHSTVGGGSGSSAAVRFRAEGGWDICRNGVCNEATGSDTAHAFLRVVTIQENGDGCAIVHAQIMKDGDAGSGVPVLIATIEYQHVNVNGGQADYSLGGLYDGWINLDINAHMVDDESDCNWSGYHAHEESINGTESFLLTDNPPIASPAVYVMETQCAGTCHNYDGPSLNAEATRVIDFKWYEDPVPPIL